MTLLIPLVLACATVTYGAKLIYVPPYVEFKNSCDQAVKEVNKHLVIDENSDITVPNRHYVTIVNALHSIVINLATSENVTKNNEIYLSEVDRAVPEALENPRKVVDEMQTLLTQIDIRTRTLKTLIETTCSFDKSPSACDQVIDTEVKGDPERYKFAAALLQAAGRLSFEFNDLRASDFAQAAVDYNELQYLINSQQDLERFVDLAVVVVQLLNSIS